MQNIYSFDNKISIDNFLLDHPLATFDAVVLGSSMAAASVVSRLIKNNKKILVIEKGSFFAPTEERPLDIDSSFEPQFQYGGKVNPTLKATGKFQYGGKVNATLRATGKFGKGGKVNPKLKATGQFGKPKKKRK